MTKKRDKPQGWHKDLEAIGDWLEQRRLISPDQAVKLESLSSEFDALVKLDPSAALPVLATLFWGLGEGEGKGSSKARTPVVAEVRSAIELTKKELSLLRERLRERFGQEFLIETEVDPSIIGGMVVRIGDLILDGSLAAKLDSLHQQLRSTGSGAANPVLQPEAESD